MKLISQHKGERKHFGALYIVIALIAVLLAGTVYIINQREARAQHQTTDDTTSLVARNLVQGDHYLGDKNAPVALIVYSDLSCPYCKEFITSTWPQIQKKYGNKVVAVFRNMPLGSIHPRAYREAEAAECVADIAGESSYWRFVYGDYAQPGYETGLSDAVLTTLAITAGANAEQFTRCLENGTVKTRIDKDLTEASVAGLTDYSPSTVAKSIVRATIVRGSYYPRFESAIDYLLSVNQSISQ